MLVQAFYQVSQIYEKRTPKSKENLLKALSRPDNRSHTDADSAHD